METQVIIDVLRHRIYELEETLLSERVVSQLKTQELQAIIKSFEGN